MPNPVGWFEIYCDDISRAQQFYESVFNLKLQPTPDPDGSLEMMFFGEGADSYGTQGALVANPEMKAGHNSVVVYFECEDCAIEEARIEANGGAIIRSKFSIGDFGFCTLFADSEGNTVGLHSSV